MSRSFAGSLTGAGAGILIGFAGVIIASGGQTARDTGAVITRRRHLHFRDQLAADNSPSENVGTGTVLAAGV